MRFWYYICSHASITTFRNYAMPCVVAPLRRRLRLKPPTLHILVWGLVAELDAFVSRIVWAQYEFRVLARCRRGVGLSAPYCGGGRLVPALGEDVEGVISTPRLGGPTPRSPAVRARVAAVAVVAQHLT